MGLTSDDADGNAGTTRVGERSDENQLRVGVLPKNELMLEEAVVTGGEYRVADVLLFRI